MQNSNERPICHRAEDLVSYLYGEASEAESRDFAGHLRLCDACRSEFNVFRQVHESILEWRSEALGASVRQVATAPNSYSPDRSAQAARRLSAIGAIREFFKVSPVWLRGATAFATVLFCLLVGFAVVRFWQRPRLVVQNGTPDKVYSRADVDREVATRVDEAVTKIKGAQASNQENPGTVKKSETTGVSHQRNPARVQLARLTRHEREQLAADLGLTLGSDDEELPFVLPDEPNY